MKCILLAVLILLNLFISVAAFGQAPEEARKELEKKEIPWSDNEFLARARTGDGKVLELFLLAGMNPDSSDSDGNTAMLLALMNGRADTVRMLLNAGAGVDAVTNTGLTALMVAASKGMVEVVHLLLDKGANVNAAARDGKMPLMFASAGGYAEIAALLIDKGAYINTINSDGGTALIMAASGGRTEVVKMLLEKGADVSVKDNAGLTAQMWAESKRHTTVARLLKRAAREEIYSGPGKTLANPQLQRDVWNYLVQIELAFDEKCQDHSTVSTDVMEYPSIPGVGIWVERWLVNRCGEQVFYWMEFRPDGKGGTYFKLIDEREPKRIEERGPAMKY